MFNYLKSDDYPIVDPSTSIKDQQESFHKLYDPKFEGKIPGAFTVKDALATHLANRQLKADITVFTTPELDYGKLIQEWQKGEMIILFSFIQNQGNAGHAMFLWGLDDNPKTPRLDIIDPLVHPNTNNKIADENYFDTKSAGTATWTDITIGKDDVGPYWQFTLTSPEYTYDLGDGNTYTYPEAKYVHKVRGFLSFSPIPEPGSLLLAVAGLLPLVWSRRQAPQ